MEPYKVIKGKKTPSQLQNELNDHAKQGYFFIGVFEDCLILRYVAKE